MNVQTRQYDLPPSSEALAIGTGPVPAAPYYCPAFFELECQAVFRRSWLQIGHMSELAEPGSFIVRELEFAKASILIVHGKDGVVRAFHNVCTHRGTQLVQEPCGKKASFSCPYHMWTYGQDGKLLSAPDFDRFYVDKAQCSLPPVAVDVCAKLIFINLDPTPRQSLRDYLGPMAAELETLPLAKATCFAEYVYEVEANWKIAYDNFQENYHLRFIHPRSGEAAAGPENPFGYPSHYGFAGLHRTQTIWSNPNPPIRPVQGIAFGKMVAAAMAEGIMNGPNNRQYFAIFPNLFILGSPTQHFSQTVMPVSATRSRSTIRIYFVGDEDNASERFAREYVMATARDIHAEDRSVIEAGQRGLSSGALKHIHFQQQEVLCRHLLHGVTTLVEAYQAEQGSVL
jgi:phenylpropionate dioxygenase-like ring-hydroxylating dioxygenase large terminal subunit